MEEDYLCWLAGKTPTSWWHDSGDPDELRRGLDHGATGVTINPVLTVQALRAQPKYWASAIRSLATNLTREEKAETLIEIVSGHAARSVVPIYETTEGKAGYACAQVNPAKAADRDAMMKMAQRFNAAAPNIAVKLPATAAGLDLLEECTFRGMTITMTISFTVAQVLASAERYQRGAARAKAAGKQPGRCFAVLMIGRLDDYLRDVAADRRAKVSESDIQQAGLAVAKRAYSIYQERGYRTVLLVAALRGTHHMVGLAGADLIMSIHPKIQAMLLNASMPRELGVHGTIAADVIERLHSIPEFAKAYEPDGLKAEEFISYGLTQRTLAQFSEAGWSLLESL